MRRRVRFVADPTVAPNRLNLEVTDMTLDLALWWIAEMVKAKVVKSGNTVRLVPKG